ncbi:MAG: hypothetical protein FWF00_07145 [Endomicrobia bacterium]|nr:hypothetical protein [Endomicrobiia bacterium]MCL2507442.1 hypothetical protein [Endomicrobiia bacterium]
MRKYIRYTIYIAVIAAVIAAGYSARKSLLIPYLQNFIHKQTGKNIKFDNFHILPFQNRIVITDLNYEDKVSVKKISARVSLFRVFRHIKTPVNYFKSAEISDINIYLDNFRQTAEPAENIVSPPQNNAFAIPLPNLPIDIHANRVSLITGANQTDINNIQIIVSRPAITFSASSFILNSSITVNSSMILRQDSLYDFNSSILSEGDIDAIISANGTADLVTFDLDQSINIEKMSYMTFDISETSGILVKKGGDFKFELNGNFGKIEVISNTPGEFEASASIDLAKINREMEALLDIAFSHKASVSRIHIKAGSVKTFNFAVRDFNITGERGKDGNYNILLDYGVKSKISIIYSGGGNYTAKLVSDGKTEGTFTGNIITGEFKADMKNVDIHRLPFSSLLDENPQGKITIEGVIDEHRGKINVVLKDLQFRNMDKTSVFGSVIRNEDTYTFNFYNSDNSAVFNSVIKSRTILSTDFKFVNTNISNVLRLFGFSASDIQGIASGRIRYEKDGTTEFDLKAVNGVIYNNKFKTLEAKGDVNLKRVSIEHFILKDDKNVTRASLKALLGFTESNPDSSLDMELKDINVAGAKLNGRISFKGILSGSNEVKGKFTGDDINISGVSFPKLSADSLISTKRFVLSELQSKNGLSGNFKADFVKKRMIGTINLKNTDLTGLYEDLTAAVNATVKVSGSFQKPSAKITANIKKGTFSGLQFVFDGDFIFESGKITVKKLDLVSEKTKVFIEGVYSRIGKLNVVFEKIPDMLINKFVGFVSPVKGDFSGSGTLIQNRGRKHLKMVLTSENMFVKNVKVNNFKSNLEIHENWISLSSATAKIADSEISAPKGNFNFRNGKYGLELKLVNFHAGPVDLFGNITLSGVMNKKKGGSDYTGTINLNNIWINRYKLPQSEFKYLIRNKTFEFNNTGLKPDLFNASGAITFGESLIIKNFTVNNKDSSFIMNSDIGDDNIRISVRGKKLSLDFLTDALDVPADLSGTANISVDFAGNPSNPSVLIKGQSTGGSIMELPYDNFEVEIVSENNKAEIKKAVIYKKNEINVSVGGFFPFWIDSSLSGELRKAPVDISYSIEDPKLTILKYIAEDYLKPLSGKISLKGSVKGTFDKISNNGRFTVTGGSFESKKYVDRVKDFNADISIVDNLITLGKLSASVGSGKVNGTGTVLLDGFTPQNFDLRFYTDNKGIPIKVPELAMPGLIFQDYSSGEPRFDITFQGSAERPKIAGWVLLENTRFTFPSANKSSGGGDFSLPEGMEFDIELRAAKNTKFENTFATAWINGSIFLRGTKDQIKANGIIDTQRGAIHYLGIEFSIINAKIEIIDNNTYISAEAEKEVFSINRSVPEIIKLIIDRSEISDLSIRFYSKEDPTVDSQTALAKVTKTEQSTNRRPRDRILGIVTEFDLRQQALRLFDTSFATPLARSVLRRTGLVDNFKVSYVAPDRDPTMLDDTSFVNLILGSKYSFEKNLTNQFLLGYSFTFDHYDQMENRLDLKHEIEMKYRLTDNLFLSGSYELESEKSMHQPDRKLMLQHQIRFGQPAKKD